MSKEACNAWKSIRSEFAYCVLIALLLARCWALGDRTMDKHRLPPSKDLTVSFQEEIRNQHLWNTCCMPETLPELFASIHPNTNHAIWCILYISKLRLREVIYFTQNHMVKIRIQNAYHGRIPKSVQWPLFPRAKQAQRPAQTFLYWVLFSWPAHLHGKKKMMNAVLFGPKQIRVFFQTTSEEVAFIFLFFIFLRSSF